MAVRAALVSRQDRPAMEPESSIKKMVSNCVRNAYGLSVEGATDAVGAEYAGAGAEYAGGASELEEGLAKGSATVGGLAGLRIGAVKDPYDDLSESIGETDFAGFDELLDFRELRVDLRLKKLKGGIDFGEKLLPGDAGQRELEEASRIRGMIR